jgi:hypothetical protein
MARKSAQFTSIEEYDKYSLSDLKELLTEEFRRDFDLTVEKYPDERMFLSFALLGLVSRVRGVSKRAEIAAGLEQCLATDQTYRHWARMPTWEHREMAALFAGLDPSSVSFKDEDIASAASGSELARKYHEVLSIMKRGGHYKVSPEEAVRWAQQFRVVVPPQLEADVALMWSVAESASESGTTQGDRKIRGDREETLLRVVAGMWELSSLPKQPNVAADRLEALFTGTGDGGWGWEKPSKKTIADTVLSVAIKLPRNKAS